MECSECHEKIVRKVGAYRCRDCGSGYCKSCAELNEFTCICVSSNIVKVKRGL